MGKVKELYCLMDYRYSNNIFISVKDAISLNRDGRLDGMLYDDGYGFEECDDDEEEDCYAS